MTTPFSAIITPTIISFTSLSGKVLSVDADHPKWANIVAAVKEVQAALKIGANEESAARTALEDMVDLGAAIHASGEGKVCVRQGVVYYNDEIVKSVIAERILWSIGEGFDARPHMKFLDNLMENPSKRSVEQLYSFIEAHKMGITDDGYILGYKRVREDFKDIFSGKFDNSPGQIVEMPRNKVDDDKSRTCSTGLHFCAMSYLSSYGVGIGSKVVIVKVNPRDIVSVPEDYEAAKVRCCRYEVLSEYTGSDLEDILKTKSVWNDENFKDSYAENDYYNYADDHDDDDSDESDYESDDNYNAAEDDGVNYEKDEPEMEEGTVPENQEVLLGKSAEDAMRKAFQLLIEEIEKNKKNDGTR